MQAGVCSPTHPTASSAPPARVSATTTLTGARLAFTAGWRCVREASRTTAPASTSIRAVILSVLVRTPTSHAGWWRRRVAGVHVGEGSPAAAGSPTASFSIWCRGRSGSTPRAAFTVSVVASWRRRIPGSCSPARGLVPGWRGFLGFLLALLAVLGLSFQFSLFAVLAVLLCLAKAFLVAFLGLSLFLGAARSFSLLLGAALGLLLGVARGLLLGFGPTLSLHLGSLLLLLLLGLALSGPRDLAVVGVTAEFGNAAFMGCRTLGEDLRLERALLVDQGLQLALECHICRVGFFGGTAELDEGVLVGLALLLKTLIVLRPHQGSLLGAHGPSDVVEALGLVAAPGLLLVLSLLCLLLGFTDELVCL
mmetsp:Transcript_11921/g.34419  ORF Transcript_11921/g.34419 Transcript_11921/m.34419 type:complete len:365 (-) Transcript_11921:2022-3116(-)